MTKLYTVLAIIGGIAIGAVIVYMRADLGTESPTDEVRQTVTPAPTATPRPVVPTTAAPSPTPLGTPVSTTTPTPSPSPTPTQEAQQPAVRTYVLQTDDDAYSPSGPITASPGDTVRITFNVSTTNVYYGGMEFRGGPVSTGTIDPGGSKTVEFTAQNSFTITAYWPSSGVVKYTIPVQIQ